MLVRFLLLLCLALTPGCFALAGWLAPEVELDFPSAPVLVTSAGRFYDVDGNGIVDFALLRGETELLDVLGYDDDEDGHFERTFRISDHAPEDVPHLVLLVDSLPENEVARRHARGDWGWFHPPQKVIPPFPSMSVVIFSELLRAHPSAGTMERYYDRRAQRMFEGYRAHLFGYCPPWQELLDYRLGSYARVGLSYLRPRAWIDSEFLGAKQALDSAQHSPTLAYVVTSSALVSRFGARGLDECLDRIEPFCVQLLHERRGAVRISIVSDHGHNLRPSTNFDMQPVLERAGFHVADGLENPERDIVLELSGLVTYFGVHTTRPAAVADALCSRPEVQLATYRKGERVLVRSRAGCAFIEEREGRLRYTPGTQDVLGYREVLDSLARAGRVDPAGFVADPDWLAATHDHEWPDAPRRLWDAFHGLVENTPDVMVTLNDGYCAGEPDMERWIDMRSTHGGLNQVNSAAVLMTMIGPIEGPLRSRDVMAAIAPNYRGPRDREASVEEPGPETPAPPRSSDATPP